VNLLLKAVRATGRDGGVHMELKPRGPLHVVDAG
jgi:hypothetical protein